MCRKLIFNTYKIFMFWHAESTLIVVGKYQATLNKGLIMLLTNSLGLSIL